MIFEQFHLTGGDRNFGYLIGDPTSRTAALVDPSYIPERLVERSRELELAVKFILVTHSHFDHTNGVAAARRLTGARVAAWKNAPLDKDIALDDGDVLSLGDLELRIIHTPGHTPDHICILAGDNLCTGDLLFVGKVGGTDYGEGARQEWDSLHHKILPLGDHIQVWPGHDFGVQPTSTLGREKASNPFLLQPTFEDFVNLKKNWLQYKKEHNII
ncbi:MAG: hydroxyacylglutathione hydrolase family protein [Candidatus Sumerlaeia bacterium]